MTLDPGQWVSYRVWKTSKNWAMGGMLHWIGGRGQEIVSNYGTTRYYKDELTARSKVPHHLDPEIGRRDAWARHRRLCAYELREIAEELAV